MLLGDTSVSVFNNQSFYAETHETKQSVKQVSAFFTGITGRHRSTGKSCQRWNMVSIQCYEKILSREYGIAYLTLFHFAGLDADAGGFQGDQV